MRAGISPSFEVMGLGQMPMAEASRFILVKAHVHAQRDLLELVGKIEVDRCVVDGVGPQNDQQRDPTLLHVVVQFLAAKTSVVRVGARWAR